MQKRAWMLLMLLGLVALRAGAQAAQGGAEQKPSPSNQMDGMDMSRTQTSPAGGSQTGMQMKMDHGQGMDMSHCMMMGSGSGDGKGMDMSHCMEMMSKEAPAPAGTLRVTFGDKSSDWTTATLAALPHSTVTVYNSHAKANETYTGVALMDLLVKVGVSEKPHGNDLRQYVVAEGSDGYKVTYSIGEVAPDLHDASVIIADGVDGKGLAGNGPFEMIDSRDKDPARWVRNLVALHVKAAE